METKLTCANCDFWDRNEHKETSGRCRVHPPKDDGVNRLVFTTNQDWCGEHSHYVRIGEKHFIAIRGNNNTVDSIKEHRHCPDCHCVILPNEGYPDTDYDVVYCRRCYEERKEHKDREKLIKR